MPSLFDYERDMETIRKFINPARVITPDKHGKTGTAGIAAKPGVPGTSGKSVTPGTLGTASMDLTPIAQRGKNRKRKRDRARSKSLEDLVAPPTPFKDFGVKDKTDAKDMIDVKNKIDIKDKAEVKGNTDAKDKTEFKGVPFYVNMATELKEKADVMEKLVAKEKPDIIPGIGEEEKEKAAMVLEKEMPSVSLNVKLAMSNLSRMLFGADYSDPELTMLEALETRTKELEGYINQLQDAVTIGMFRLRDLRAELRCIIAEREAFNE